MSILEPVEAKIVGGLSPLSKLGSPRDCKEGAYGRTPLFTKTSAAELRFEAYVDEGLAVVQGHFPQQPTVPAFALLEWITNLLTKQASEEALPPFTTPSVRVSFKRVKFLLPLVVPAQIRVRFHTTSSDSFRFVVDGRGLHSRATTSSDSPVVAFTKGECAIVTC
jgi:3-hydroxymyristoyl/3-hydroxydecanoyl-(acyl carrier protein) dehydratase